MGNYQGVTDESVRAASIAGQREEQWRKAQGVIAETCHRSTIGGLGVYVSGSFYFGQIFLRAGEVCANSSIAAGAPAGSNQTLGRVGLYDTAGNLLASCANTVAAWSTPGIQTQAFTTPYTVTATGIYFIGLIIVASTTVPAIETCRNANANAIGIATGIGSAPIMFGVQAGLSDLPSPLTVAVGAAPALPWIAVS